MSKCSKCGGIRFTASPLTRQGAEQLAAQIAKELREAAPALSEEGALWSARKQILLKRPTLIIKCDGCGYETI